MYTRIFTIINSFVCRDTELHYDVGLVTEIDKQ